MTRAQRWTLVATVLASATVFLDATVVNVALPRIGRDLPHSIVGVLEGQTYVYAGYLLSLSSLLILAGALTDTYGRRRMFMLGLAAFGASSALCGLAPSLEVLVVLRVVQGIAGAFLVPGSLALISAGFSGPLRGRAYGIWSGAAAGTTLLGPAVGGVLVDTISWRAAFLINIPIALIALYATWRHVPESRSDEPPAGFDWLGAIIVGIAVGGLSFGTIYGQQRDWHDPVAFVILAAGFLGTAVAPFYMARAPHPLIPLSLFKSHSFTTINISTLLIYGDRLPARRAHLRPGPGHHGGSAHSSAHGVRSSRPRGPGILDQQCCLAHRPAAGRRCCVRGGDGRVLHVTGRPRSGSRPQLAGASGGGPPVEQANRERAGQRRRACTRGVGRRLSRRHADRGRSVHRWCGRQRDRRVEKTAVSLRPRSATARLRRARHPGQDEVELPGSRRAGCEAAPRGRSPDAPLSIRAGHTETRGTALHRRRRRHEGWRPGRDHWSRCAA
ncbi:MAG: MFS transporter [Chloroflexi bacterium]|nr:MAG: MFS transporter [Chloroflexota bacterium]